MAEPTSLPQHDNTEKPIAPWLTLGFFLCSLSWIVVQLILAEELPSTFIYFVAVTILLGASYVLSRFRHKICQTVSKFIFAGFLLLVFTRLFFAGGGFESPVAIWLIMLPLFFRVAVSKNASRIGIVWVSLVMTTELVLHFHYGISLKSPYIDDMYGMGVFNLPIAFVLIIFITKSYEYWHHSSIQKDHLIIKEQQKTIQSQTAFMTNMSHELRTPLNGIFGVFQILQHDLSRKDVLIEAGMRSTEALTTILSDILDAQKLHEGKVKLNEEWLSSEATLGYISHLYESLADTKKLNFRVEGLAELPQEIYCDNTRVGQILNNIVGNAFKFTEQGSIRVCFRYDDGNLNITVKDSGIGMSKAVLDSLFDRFTQADISTTKRFGGSGLGMAITRELVALMKGTVNVESEEGSGTTFKLCLPIAAREGHKSHNSVIQSQPDLGDITLLVVEDNEINNLVTSAMLEGLFKQVITAKDGREGLSLISSTPVDLVVTDIQMPVMDGLALKQAIASSHPKLPVIALTGNAYESQIEEYLAQGFSRVVSKPIVKDVLLAAIKDTLSGKVSESRQNA
ncbi:ATP-binding protein [Alteromonas lipolytica]|uniref:histidine kinase n=1 Tax=Alteromonas lipolytica TaxID=1856405 RepID=A0A1E8F893_9ALTE|nr:ATP-binding protein [Alteromonas lipolytica]OFI32132.1 hypothetical protein BFC17_07850 [Alteromonas lipolytica]GGF83622.1 hypothetical protein GCM10011338_39970 [Alteromonas lipolytica]